MIVDLIRTRTLVVAVASDCATRPMASVSDATATTVWSSSPSPSAFSSAPTRSPMSNVALAQSNSNSPRVATRIAAVSPAADACSATPRKCSWKMSWLRASEPWSFMAEAGLGFFVLGSRYSRSPISITVAEAGATNTGFVSPRR